MTVAKKTKRQNFQISVCKDTTFFLMGEIIEKKSFFSTNRNDFTIFANCFIRRKKDTATAKALNFS